MYVHYVFCISVHHKLWFCVFSLIFSSTQGKCHDNKTKKRTVIAPFVYGKDITCILSSFSMGEFGRLIWQHWTGNRGGGNWVRSVWSESVVYSPNRPKKVQNPFTYSKRKYGISGFVTLRNTTKQQNWSALPCVIEICPPFLSLTSM